MSERPVGWWRATHVWCAVAKKRSNGGAWQCTLPVGHAGDHSQLEAEPHWGPATWPDSECWRPSAVAPKPVRAPRAPLSEAAKQSIRRKSLERRMRANNPLFADAAIASALAAQPAYYGAAE